MTEPVASHYGRPDLTARIIEQLSATGVDPGAMTPAHLAGVDEFHLGGKAATLALCEALGPVTGDRVLDVGCGIGGAARTIATTLDCSVTGVDLTAEFVQTARELSAAVGLDGVTDFDRADALRMPFDDASFAATVMVHVGMNVADKESLMSELARTVRPGGTVVVYDIMRVGDGDVAYPTPWATDATMSFPAEPATYVDAMAAAGLEPGRPVDRRPLVSEALAAAASNPPPVNLSHLMGERWPTMFANLVAALESGTLAPIQIAARRPA